MIKTSRLLLGLLLAMGLVLTGCEEIQCEECVDCPSFLGEYYGSIEALNETCQDVALLTGDTQITVIGQTPLQLDSRDSNGKWSVFAGSLCDTTDEEDPKTYFFTTYYSPESTGGDYTLDYSLIGFFTAEYQVEETTYPTTVTATLDLRFVYADGEICTLSGDIRGTRTTLP